MHCIGALHICSTNLSPANVPRHAIAIFTNVLQAELDHSKKSFCDHFPPNPRKNLGHKKFKCPDSGLQRQQQSQNLN